MNDQSAEVTPLVRVEAIDGNTFGLTVEPYTAIRALRAYIDERRPDDLDVVLPTQGGDMTVRTRLGKDIGPVLLGFGAVEHVIEARQPVRPMIDVHL